MGLSPSRGLVRWAPFLVFLALPGMSGCGSSNAKVSGKVYIDGKLLKGGNVMFVHTEAGKQSQSTKIEPDGSYKLANLAPGKVKIAVETESLNPGTRSAMKYKPPEGQKAPAGLSGSTTDTSDQYVAIPASYSDAGQSGLTYEIKSGSQTHDIQLSSGASEGVAK